MVALVMLVASGQAFAQTDYDANNNGLIGITNLAQLNAIRWDLNADGVVDTSASATDSIAYFTAFSNPASGMGCPATGCTGYELLNSLDFDEDGDRQITATDTTYWNNGTGWSPIGWSLIGGENKGYAGNFKGNGYTINNLFINKPNASSYVLQSAIIFYKKQFICK